MVCDRLFPCGDRLPYHPYPGDIFFGVVATRFIDGSSSDRIFPKKSSKKVLTLTNNQVNVQE